MRITVEYFDKHITMGRIATYKVTTVWLFGFIPVFQKRERIMGA